MAPWLDIKQTGLYSSNMSRSKATSEARQRILDTADRLFYQEGVRAVGIDRIIDEANVAKMSLYKHFPSKDDLILAVLKFREEGVLNFFRSAMERHDKQFKPYVLDGKTVILSPHKVYGSSTNDMILQLRKRRIEKVIMAGPAGNLCVEAHFRDLLECGFEVAMVRDAIGGTSNEEGDGVQAALVNFRFLAHALWTTEEALNRFASLSRAAR
jgi:AcrR family transcriptional regulator